MKKSKLLWTIFVTFFKIGLFTFGGGYAMIALLEREFVGKKQWIKNDEFLDMLAIAESTPGPIAINMATYIGYSQAGFFGSFFATLAVCLPSFIIIFAISLFFDKFLALKLVGYAFRGIQACVTFLILQAGLKMLKEMKKGVMEIILFTLTVGCFVAFTLFAVDFSSIFYILIGAVVGLVIYLISDFKKCKEPMLIEENAPCASEKLEAEDEKEDER